MVEEPPRRRPRRPKGTPYWLLFAGLGMALLGLRQANRVLMAAGAALFAVALLVGYARSPPPSRAP
jgi:hypothetical protein